MTGLPQIPAARGGSTRVAHLIGSNDGASRLTAVLREFDAAYVAGGNEAVASDAMLSRQLKARRIDGLDVVKKHGR